MGLLEVQMSMLAGLCSASTTLLICRKSIVRLLVSHCEYSCLRACAFTRLHVLPTEYYFIRTVQKGAHHCSIHSQYLFT